MHKAQPKLELDPKDVFAFFRLMAFLLAPYDLERQKQALAVDAANLLVKLDAPKDGFRRLYVSQRFLKPAGGYAALTAAPSNSQLNQETSRVFASSAAAVGAGTTLPRSAD